MKIQSIWKVSRQVDLDETCQRILSKNIALRLCGGRPQKGGESPDCQISVKLKGCSILISAHTLHITGEYKRAKQAFFTIAPLIETGERNVDFDLRKIVIYNQETLNNRLGTRATWKSAETFSFGHDGYSSYSKTVFEDGSSTFFGSEIITKNGKPKILSEYGD